MSDAPAERTYWRVGYHGDPLGFVPSEICEWSHRFDDLRHRFRTVYVAELAETCLREVLADFRPNLGAIRRFQQEMGAEAAQELAAQPITAAWRRENILAPVRLRLDGGICDLTDAIQRQGVEERHVDLLLEHDMRHLDLHEITTNRRVVTQTVAADIYDDGAAAIRFPSCLDGNPCVAIFEGRGALELAGEILPLTDPPPTALLKVVAPWHLDLPASSRRHAGRPSIGAHVVGSKQRVSDAGFWGPIWGPKCAGCWEWPVGAGWSQVQVLSLPLDSRWMPGELRVLK